MITLEEQKQKKNALLTKEIKKAEADGWKVFGISSGLIAPATPQAKLHRMLKSCRAAHPSGWEVDFLVGGKAATGKRDGRHFAVIVRPKQVKDTKTTKEGDK